MSQIYLTTKLSDASTLRLTMGFDRRLSTCFLSVHPSEIDDEDEEETEEAPARVLSAKEQAIEDLNAVYLAHQLIPAGIQSLLSLAKISFPSAALDELVQHVVQNAGNVVVEYDIDGNRRELYSDGSFVLS